MPKLTIVYGLVDEHDGHFSISFPDVRRCDGRGLTREAAIDNGAMRLRKWALGEREAGRVFMPLSAQELGWDDAVKLALQLGMELVAVPL
jgi:predicted RNase H-like HicB family nuclease